MSYIRLLNHHSSKMPEKRNIYFWALIVLKCGGTWNPFKSTDKLYKRVLYAFYIFISLVQCGFWEVCQALVFIYDFQTVDMNVLTITMAYLMELMLSNAKMAIVNYKRKDYDWLVEQTEVYPFYRENDDEFKKELRASVATSTRSTRIFWASVFLTLNMAALNAFVVSLSSSYTMNKNCNKKLNIYREKFLYSNETLPDVLGVTEIYQQVELIEAFIEEGSQFKINPEIECSQPQKILPYGGHTPYDHHKYYAVSFISQFLSFWSFASQNIPLDMLIMCTMIHLKFQFQCVINKLLNLRKDCIERLGTTEEEVDEQLLVDEIKNRLKSIIFHHESIFQYYYKTEECYTWVLFSQYFGTSIMMCVMMYTLAFSDNIFTLKFLQICCFMTGIILQLYMNCHYGNELIIVSELVADAAFQCGWEKSGRYSPQLKPYIQMIMCRSLRPTQLSAGKFAFISLATFMTIGKTSYSYYTVMSKSKQ